MLELGATGIEEEEEEEDEEELGNLNQLLSGLCQYLY
jgi:hypothetical protein